jgi:hypothetical protein
MRDQKPFRLDAALNEQISFQVAMRLEGEPRQQVSVEVLGPDNWSIRARRVGFVPVRHLNPPIMAGDEMDTDIDGRGYIPGYVPDPLFGENELLLPESETHAFWVTVRPGPEATPGTYTLDVVVRPQDGEVTHNVEIKLHDVIIAARQDFHITHWFYIDALMDWYATDGLDVHFWTILPAYIRDVVEHGQDMLYVPVFTPPLDGVKRPSQLLWVTREGPDTYHFDWRDVKRYVDLARQCGITHFEWCHFFTQWGAEHAIRIYEGAGRTMAKPSDEVLLWPSTTGATSEVYRTFLAQYLPALYRFLEVEGLLDCSFFHLSDEPHGEAHLRQYRAARDMLRSLAPWMRVMDALTDIEYARQGLTDMPIPSIRTALDFVEAEIPSWCYYCCGPRGTYLNRLLDTPLPKIAMHGFLFYRWPFKGFLHWGYNYWYKSQTCMLIDPYTVQDGLAWQRGWAYGDPFVVYPGADGPLDSIRWEVFSESLQDYALLQTLGIPRDHELLTPLKSFEDFPKTATWRRDVRRRLLQEHSER